MYPELTSIRRIFHLLLLAVTINCQGQHLDVIQYTTNNSRLPHDICYKLTQDKNGYLWICTDDGLVRFDGRDMKVYHKGFRSNFVIAAASRNNDLFLSTWKGGIHRLYHDSVQEVRLKPNDINRTLHLYTSKIILFNDIVILHHNGSTEVHRYDSDSNTIGTMRLYIREDNGLSSIDPKNVPFSFCVKDNTLIAYNEHGVYELKGDVLEHRSKQVFSCITAANGLLYGADRESRNIYILNPDFKAGSLVRNIEKEKLRPAQKVKKLLVLPSGNLIINFSAFNEHTGLNDETAVFINLATGQTFDLLKELDIRVTLGDIIADRESGFWISTDGQGLYHVFEPRYMQYGHYREFVNPSVTDFAESGKDTLYIGTKKGLYLLNRDKTKLIYPDYAVSCFFRDSNGMLTVQPRVLDSRCLRIQSAKAEKTPASYLYFQSASYTLYKEVTEKIIFRDRINKKTFYGYSLQWPSPVRCLYEDDNHILWIAADKGLFCYDPAQQVIHLYNNKILQGNPVSVIIRHPSGGMWVGGNSGLFYLNGSTIRKYGESQGLSNERVSDLMLYGNHLWIATQDGLNILDLSAGFVSVYKTHDGLIANDVTALYLSEGRVYAGSSKGFTVIPVSRPAQYNIQPQIIAEHLVVNDREMSFASAVSVPYKSHISFSYNIISFVYPEMLRFEYRLSGEDKWIETPNKTISLSNLEPGNYKLEVRGKKYNSAWSEPVVITLSVDTPWWQSIWFYAGILLLILSLVYYALKRHNNKIKKEALLQRQFSELKLKALQTQLNPHFISNALNAIQLFVLKQDEASVNKYLTRFANLTRLLLESSRTRFLSIEHELQITDYYLSLEQLRFRERFTYTITIEQGIDTRAEPIPGVLLQPFAENSINHGILHLPKDSKGHINICISRQHESILIVIEDNGVGMKRAAEIQKTHGRVFHSRSSEIISEICQVLGNLPGCRIDIDKEELNPGTRIRINYVINRNYRPQI